MNGDTQVTKKRNMNENNDKTRVTYIAALLFGFVVLLLIIFRQNEIEQASNKENIDFMLVNPPTPEQNVQRFIEDIEGMDRTNKREDFLKSAHQALENGEISDVEYDYLKKRYHNLQEIAQ